MFRPEESPQLVEFPKDLQKTDTTYLLLRPFAKAHLFYRNGEIHYEIIEPELTRDDEVMLEKLHQGLLQTIDISPEEVKDPDELMKYLNEKIKRLLEEYGISISEKHFEKLMYYIYRNFVGLNEIEAVMHDEYIEDINCNGTKTPLYVKHRILGNLRSNICFTENEKLKNFIIKLAQRCDKYITYSDPFLEGSLPDGSRVQGTISDEVSPRGPNFSIRKFRHTPFSPTELLHSKTISPQAMAYLWYLIEKGSNILIIGGSGAGKTTLLNVIATFIPEKSKVVSIEDTREIKLFHENWTATVARASIGGMRLGEVGLEELLRESFRENPDHVLVGEVRGKETYIMFQGMASGHPTMATFHSEDIDSVLNRLKTPPINLPGSLIELLDVVVTIDRIESQNHLQRRVSKIEEFRQIDERTGKAVTTVVSSWNSKDDSFEDGLESFALAALAKKSGLDIKDVRREIEKRKAFLEKLSKEMVLDIGQVHREIQTYYSKS
ncbi:MAG: type II/IV secretion system ATPase subunit [Candidatus Aenigmarchaeota archaeon]|nr:type II/IV secretion system ATPase subunit [Candidatus Aenigmarchaeota archaeon]